MCFGHKRKKKKEVKNKIGKEERGRRINGKPSGISYWARQQLSSLYLYAAQVAGLGNCLGWSLMTGSDFETGLFSNSEGDLDACYHVSQTRTFSDHQRYSDHQIRVKSTLR